jgi:catechol 2,3-dioxygenase-like lactoylglutathione lyase family enzyme
MAGRFSGMISRTALLLVITGESPLDVGCGVDGAGLQWRRVPSILQNHYVLAVHDVRASAKFYVEALGFRITAQPPGWIFVAKDNCTIMLGECPDDLHPSRLGCHNYFAYLRVDDADAYFKELSEKRVELLGPIEDKPWGMREFGIRTPDGHRIMIGQAL